MLQYLLKGRTNCASGPAPAPLAATRPGKRSSWDSKIVSESEGTKHEEDRLITEAQLAEMLGCSRIKLRQDRAAARGVPFVKFEGRMVRYSLRTVRDYIARHTIGVAS